MPSSTPRPSGPKFLLDENVRIELSEFLEREGCDTKAEPKGTPDEILAAISRRERRAVVTNDGDFAPYTKDRIFSVVWLRIPQKDVTTLIASFKKMLTECKTFAQRLIIVEPNRWRAFPLGTLLKLRGGVRIIKYG